MKLFPNRKISIRRSKNRNERGEHLLARHAIVSQWLIVSISSRKDRARRYEPKDKNQKGGKKRGNETEGSGSAKGLKINCLLYPEVVDDHLAPGFFRIFSSNEISFGLSVLTVETRFFPFPRSILVSPRDHVGSTPRRCLGIRFGEFFSPPSVRLPRLLQIRPSWNTFSRATVARDRISSLFSTARVMTRFEHLTFSSIIAFVKGTFVKSFFFFERSATMNFLSFFFVVFLTRRSQVSRYFDNYVNCRIERQTSWILDFSASLVSMGDL